jgi:hypothetical protein
MQRALVPVLLFLAAGGLGSATASDFTPDPRSVQRYGPP